MQLLFQYIIQWQQKHDNNNAKGKVPCSGMRPGFNNKMVELQE